jgi:hypothetical protein
VSGSSMSEQARDCWTLWPPFGGSRFGKGSSHRRRWGAVRRYRCVPVHRPQPGDGPSLSVIMNPGRFNHEPSGLVFCRSPGPDRRTRVSQGGQPCADIMNLAGFIMNPLGWCFVRRQRLLCSCVAMTGFVMGFRAIPLTVAATGSPTIRGLCTEWQAIETAPPPRAACRRLAACEPAIADLLRQRRSAIAQLVA